ncbi:dynein heavy chain 7, axonemal-like [Orussus abietinus]|uniref:dynein heavy chain 7, axonemal-like n=1 Tax=Orussus abietinus TaxID=222816 RepID=UPI000625A17B|nr:dynein heavy chain 7, axonemal-like [Orussus abietinus]
MAREERFDIFYEKAKVPRMNPVPSVLLKDERHYRNTLRKFRGQRGKLEELPAVARKVEKLSRQINPNEQVEYPFTYKPILPKSYYISKLRDWAREIPIVGLLPHWESSIQDLVPIEIRKRRAEMFEALLEETKGMYNNVMRDFGIRSIIGEEEDLEKSERSAEPTIVKDYRCLPRSLFLKRRSLLAKNYFLFHSLMQTIMAKASLNLPPMVFDFSRYRSLGLLSLAEFQDSLTKDLRRGALVIRNHYYNEIVRVMSRLGRLRDIPAEKRTRFVRGATQLFVQQIINIMINTINRMIAVLADAKTCPLFDLHLLCEEEDLIVLPGVEDIYLILHQIIDGVPMIAQDLISFEEWLGMESEKEYVEVKLPAWFTESSHEKLEEVLNDMFGPLIEYLDIVNDRFSTLTSSETRIKMADLISERRPFETYCKHVERFRFILKEITPMVSNVYYDIGKLRQEPAKETLKKKALDFIEALIGEAVAYQKDWNQTICSDFEELKAQALNIPNEVKDLFELSEYISYASTELLDELRLKVVESIRMTSALLRIATLTDDHLELNRQTINWLELIKPVFDRHSVLCEAMKSELEDELQRKVAVLNEKADELTPKLTILNEMDDARRVREYMNDLRVLVKETEGLEEGIEEINAEERLFKFPETIFPKVVDIRETIMSFYTLNYLICQWQRDHAVWLDGPFEYLDADVIKERSLYYAEEFAQIGRTYKAKIKADSGTNKPFKFSGVPDDPDLSQQPAPVKLCWQTLKEVNDFKGYVDLAVCMCNAALVKRHWDAMSEIAGFDLTPDAGTTLKKIIALDIMHHVEKFQGISIGADKELALERQLGAMIKEWDTIEFPATVHEKSGLTILTESYDVDILLEEQLVKVQEMRGSFFVRPIETEVLDFLGSLMRIQKTMDEWSRVQETWLRLYPVFCDDSTAVGLAREKTAFFQVKDTLQSSAAELSGALIFEVVGKSPKYLDSMLEAGYILEVVHEGVRAYLEEARLRFSRFFLLSDEEMMKVLFEVDGPKLVQPYLKKCFRSIEKLGLDEKSQVQSIIGPRDEELQLQKCIPTTGTSKCIEIWLPELEREMKNSLRRKLVECKELFNRKLLIDYVTSFPSMIVICILRMYWTSAIHYCFLSSDPATLKSYREEESKHLADMIQSLHLSLDGRTRIVISILITVAIDQIETIDMLIDKNVTKDLDFYWKSQLRFYYQDEVNVSMIKTTITYGYEFTCIEDCFVRTSLTDRGICTLMEAYRQCHYTAMTGSSSTGKAESIKALGNAIALNFLLFNCTENLDLRSLERILKGLVSCGAWIYLKNFDLINVDVLSIISEQLVRIRQAICSKSSSMNFGGIELNINPRAYICVGISPGHPGRSVLSDNLKILFRTVSISVPDLKKICEVHLVAAGFSDAKPLAGKMSKIQELSSKYLSETYRHHFGVRSLKTVIKNAIRLKISSDVKNENEIILRSLMGVNLPMLTKEDALLFQGFLRDTFPNVVMTSPRNSEFLHAFAESCKKREVICHENLTPKALEILETMRTRHSLLIVGEPFGGKTTILQTLADTLCYLYQQGNTEIGSLVKYETINPKALSFERLFGFINPKSKEWNEGILPNTFRIFAEAEELHKKWMILDGPVDNIWMDALIDTSPGTVSRCGVIHIDSKIVGWKPFVKSWIASNRTSESHEKILKTLFNWSLEPSLSFISKNCTTRTPLGEIQLVKSMLDLFGIYIQDGLEENSEDTEKSSHLVTWCQAATILSTVWGLAGHLDGKSQSDFDCFYVSLWTGKNPLHPLPEMVKLFEMALPTEGSLQDNVYLFKGSGCWRYWGEYLKIEQIAEASEMKKTVIPTVDTLKCSDVFLRHVKHRKPFLLCGDSAVGKTSCLYDLLANKLSSEEYLTNFLNFTPDTTADEAQKLILSRMSRLRKGYFGAPKMKFCLNVIDDLNRAKKDTYGSQSAVELIRQFMDHEYWFDLKKPSKIYMSDVLFLSALTLGGPEDKISPRFLRHFSVYFFNSPSKDSIFRIFSNLLNEGLMRNLFAPDIISSVNSIASASMEVYLSAVEKLLPVPGKLEYRFNLRDMSKIMEGCCLIQKESVDTKIAFLRLWVHEALRVFSDRIAEEEDKEWVFQKIKESAISNFKDPFESAFDHLPKFSNSLTKESFQSLVFCNLADVNKNLKYRRYEELSKFEILKNRCLAYLNEYNETSKVKLNILPVRYALEHLVRICRVLVIRGGSLLMISVGGCGGKTLTKLAAHIERQYFFEVAVTPLYDSNSWKQDLKMILRKCGAEEKDVTFLLTEKQIRREFLQDIDSLLTTGEVLDLFTLEEKQKIVEMTRMNAQKGDQNLDMSFQEVMDYFIARCREKLHFVLCFSPINDTLRKHLLSYPSLVDYCFINQLQPWPEEALEDAASTWMKEMNLSEDLKSASVISLKYFFTRAKEISEKHYTSSKHLYPPSSAFFHMLRLFGNLLSNRREEITAKRNRFLNGLEKLELAERQVADMQTMLMKLKPQLELSAEQTATTMKEIERENLTIEKATVVVKQEEEIANKKAEVAGILKAECEAELAVAIPILEDAVAALNTLKPTDITLVKAMKNPPDTIKLVLAAVCVILGVSPDKSIDPESGKKIVDFWGPTKRVLGDMNFLQVLKDFDKDNIPSHQMNVIKRTYITDKNFVPHVVAKASSAAEGLCKWVLAMVSYDEVAKVVAPKKEKLMAAQKECDEAGDFLNEKRKTLAALNAKLENLNSSLRETLNRKLTLEKEVAECTRKMVKAESLIVSLGGEKTRWTRSAKMLKTSFDNILGDVLLSCGIIGCLASFGKDLRQDCEQEWRSFILDSKIPHTFDFDIVELFGSEVKLNSWHLNGLSRNRFILENAVIMEKSLMWPLLIDPQNHASDWIKETEKYNDLVLAKTSDRNFVNALRRSMEKGRPVLLENVQEGLESILKPILAKDVFQIGENYFLKIGENEFHYSNNFRLYLVSKIRCPCYSPDVYSKVTVIDFSLPVEALRDRLLDIVASREKPELQEKFEKVRIEDADNRKSLGQAENNVLITLSTSDINVLEDENAIRILEAFKNMTIRVDAMKEAAKIVEKQVEECRKIYEEFCEYCAIMFGTISNLSRVDFMYQFSLSWLIRVYVTSIEISKKSPLIEKRLMNLRASFTKSLRSAIQRTLFEEHKLLYSFLLHSTILLHEKKISKEELDFLASDEKFPTETPNPFSEWLPEKSWSQISRASSTLPIFRELGNHICAENRPWKEFYDAKDPQNLPLPGIWEEKLTSFQKLLILKMIRPDRVVSKVEKFLEAELGEDYISLPNFDLSSSYSESTCLTPLIFLLPSYSDPVEMVRDLSKKVGHSSRFVVLSMGKGLEDKAMDLIRKGEKSGWWIFLQNCHLVLPSLAEIGKICENFRPNSTSLEFRLWLSSYSDKRFPLGILQNGVKIACGPPRSLKGNLFRIYNSKPMNELEFFEGCPGKDKVFSKLLYGLCFFHSLVRERTNFGISGFNYPYEFDQSDMRISALQLQIFLKEEFYIPFNSISYLVGQCNHGGKMTNKIDLKCLNELLLDCYNESVVNDIDYHFLTDKAECKVPNRCEYKDYVSHIQTIPRHLQN